MARKIIDSYVKILSKEIDNFWSRDTWKVKSTVHIQPYEAKHQRKEEEEEKGGGGGGRGGGG